MTEELKEKARGWGFAKYAVGALVLGGAAYKLYTTFAGKSTSRAPLPSSVPIAEQTPPKATKSEAKKEDVPVGAVHSDFVAASEFIKVDKSLKISQDDQLRLYGFFKQTNAGPCTTSRPSAWNMADAAKWDAWHALGAQSKADASTAYVTLVDKLAPGWRSKAAIKPTEPQPWPLPAKRDGETKSSASAAESGAKPAESKPSDIKAASTSADDIEVDENDPTDFMTATGEAAAKRRVDGRGHTMLGGVSRPVLAEPAAAADASDAAQNSVPFLASKGDVAGIRKLIADGASVNAVNADGQTALHIATELDNAELTTLLVSEFKADYNVKDSAGDTPLYCACVLDFNNIVKLLLSFGARLDADADRNGFSAQTLALLAAAEGTKPAAAPAPAAVAAAAAAPKAEEKAAAPAPAAVAATAPAAVAASEDEKHAEKKTAEEVAPKAAVSESAAEPEEPAEPAPAAEKPAALVVPSKPAPASPKASPKAAAASPKGKVALNGKPKTGAAAAATPKAKAGAKGSAKKPAAAAASKPAPAAPAAAAAAAEDADEDQAAATNGSNGVSNGESSELKDTVGTGKGAGAAAADADADADADGEVEKEAAAAAKPAAAAAVSPKKPAQQTPQPKASGGGGSARGRRRNNRKSRG